MKTLMFLILLFGLTSCSSMARVEDIAKRSYELGCVDRGNGKATDNLMCHMASEKFANQLHMAWGQ